MDLLIRIYENEVVPALPMDQQFDVLFAIDDDSRLTNVAHDFSITQVDRPVDNVVEYKRTIAAIEIHLAIMLLPSMNDSTVRRSRGVLVQCRPI